MKEVILALEAFPERTETLWKDMADLMEVY